MCALGYVDVGVVVFNCSLRSLYTARHLGEGEISL